MNQGISQNLSVSPQHKEVIVLSNNLYDNFSGIYYHNRGGQFSATLILNKDSSFVLTYNADLGSSTSYGNWKSKEPLLDESYYIVLNTEKVVNIMDREEREVKEKLELMYIKANDEHLLFKIFIFTDKKYHLTMFVKSKI